MPIYEFKCLKCDNKFELLRPISRAGEEAECPRCQASSRRAISKFVSRAKDDLSSMINSMPSSGSSCSGCSSTNCSSCNN